MLTFDEIKEIVSDIKFRDWTFRVEKVGPFGAGFMFLQVQFYAPDTTNPYPSINPQGLRIPKGQTEYETRIQGGRKWILSPHMTRSEVVQTALMAMLTAVEHEAREEFRYKGQAVFGPHMDVTMLASNLAAHGDALLEVRE